MMDCRTSFDYYVNGDGGLYFAFIAFANHIFCNCIIYNINKCITFLSILCGHYVINSTLSSNVPVYIFLTLYEMNVV